MTKISDTASDCGRDACEAGLGGIEWVWGEHCENALVQTLFSLLLWDVLWPARAMDAPSYASTPDCASRPTLLTAASASSASSSAPPTPNVTPDPSSAFRGAVQDFPLDLLESQLLHPTRHGGGRAHSSSARAMPTSTSSVARSTFLQRCSVMTETLFERILVGEGPSLIRRNWIQHFGKACRGVDWSRFSLSKLQAVASGLGGRALSGICRTLAEDFCHWRHGLPDLVILTPCRLSPACPSEAKRASPHVRFIEVKGPGDSLSVIQSLWLDRLLELGVDVCVAKVTAAPKAR